MLNQFVQYLNQFISLSEKDIEVLGQLVKIRKIKKGEHLLRAGEISRAFYFNVSGFVRLYYLKDGAEKTANFYPPNSFISAYASFINASPTKLNFQASEDSALIEISTSAATELLAYSRKFEAMARIAMESELVHYQEIVASLLTLSPEERYGHLLEHHPAIFQKSPQHQIASYIGVQPESLSRIKKRVSKKS